MILALGLLVFEMNIVDEYDVLFVDLPAVVPELDSICFSLNLLASPKEADDDDGESGADDEADDARHGRDDPESQFAGVERVFIEMSRFRFRRLAAILAFRHFRLSCNFRLI